MSLIPFEQMPYERLEEGELRRQAGEILEKLLRAPDYPAAKDAFMEMQKLSSHFSTLSAIANTRSNIDTTDAFYAQQREYWDHLDPVFEELQQRFTGAMLTHPFRPQFEEMLGKQYFADGELAQRSFSPAIAPLMQEESKLVMAYDQIMAGAQIVFDGKTLTLPQLTPYKQSPHPDIRKAAWCAEGEYLMSHAQQLDDIFHQLVKLRTEMGRKMGYDTFIPLGYDRMKRNCYGAGQVEAFREAVRRHIVPIAAALKRQQAQRLNTSYPMMLSDDSIVFPTGNPLPRGNAQDTLDTARNMYHQLSPETGAFIDVMFEGHLLDVLSKKGKAGGGYCTTLPDYKVPFIFANFNGTAGDVEVMTHEAGHAFAAYMARDIVALEQRWPTLEACEVHSMSMEFFAEEWSETSLERMRINSGTVIWLPLSPLSPMAPLWTPSSTRSTGSRNLPPCSGMKFGSGWKPIIGHGSISRRFPFTRMAAAGRQNSISSRHRFTISITVWHRRWRFSFGR